MPTEGVFGPNEMATFTRSLAEFKRRGTNLLVVGQVHGDCHVGICRRLLGETDVDPRRRLFVFTGNMNPHERLPGQRTDFETTTVIAHATRTRSTVATVDSFSTPIETIHVDDERLASLAAVVVSEIDTVQAESHGLSPAELRVCFDSLLHLFTTTDDGTVFRFLRVLTAAIRRVKGMGHFHFPVDIEEESVHTVAPLFDAIIQLRYENGYPEQRWHLRDSDITSDWLLL